MKSSSGYLGSSGGCLDLGLTGRSGSSPGRGCLFCRLHNKEGPLTDGDSLTLPALQGYLP